MSFSEPCVSPENLSHRNFEGVEEVSLLRKSGIYFQSLRGGSWPGRRSNLTTDVDEDSGLNASSLSAIMVSSITTVLGSSSSNIPVRSSHLRESRGSNGTNTALNIAVAHKAKAHSTQLSHRIATTAPGPTPRTSSAEAKSAAASANCSYVHARQSCGVLCSETSISWDRWSAGWECEITARSARLFSSP